MDTILNASEEIMEVSPTKEWDAAVRIQLKPHRDYLLSSYYQSSGYLEQYGARFRAFLHEVLDDPRHTPPPPPPSLAKLDASETEGRQACLSSSSTAKSTRCRPASP